MTDQEIIEALKADKKEAKERLKKLVEEFKARGWTLQKAWLEEIIEELEEEGVW